MNTLSRSPFRLPESPCTGNLLVGEVLGRCNCCGIDPHAKLGYEEALEVARRFQPPDPIDPYCPRLRLRMALAQELGADPRAVTVGTALESPLYRHHLDGWVQYDEATVTVSLTFRPGVQRGAGDVTWFVASSGEEPSCMDFRAGARQVAYLLQHPKDLHRLRNIMPRRLY